MGKAKPFDVNGKHFKSATELRAAVRYFLKGIPDFMEFTSDLLSDLGLKYHYCASKYGYRPELFNKAHPRPGVYWKDTEFKAFFPQDHPKTPGQRIGWRNFSWKKCIDGTNYLDEVQKTLRRRAAPALSESREWKCQRCGRGYTETVGLEVDHMDPTFAEIWARVKQLITKEEIESWAYFECFDEEMFTLPEGHPALREFDAIHATAKVQTLCYFCHQTVTAERKRAVKAMASEAVKSGLYDFEKPED